jgi:hypothetical protein
MKVHTPLSPDNIHHSMICGVSHCEGVVCRLNDGAALPRQRSHISVGAVEDDEDVDADASTATTANPLAPSVAAGGGTYSGVVDL